MGGRGRGSGGGRAGGPGGGGTSPGSSGGDAPLQVSKAEIKDAVAQAVNRIPSSVRNLLAKRGAGIKVIDRKQAELLLKKSAAGVRGFYDPYTKQSHVIVESFQNSRGARNAGMTGLHELGHAFDFLLTPGTRIIKSKQFQTALAKDQKNLHNVKLSAPQRQRMTYQHYPARQRSGEIFAEAFAVAHGIGRPTPAKDWNNSKRFQKAYPEVVKFVKGLK